MKVAQRWNEAIIPPGSFTKSKTVLCVVKCVDNNNTRSLAKNPSWFFPRREPWLKSIPHSFLPRQDIYRFPSEQPSQLFLSIFPCRLTFFFRWHNMCEFRKVRRLVISTRALVCMTQLMVFQQRKPPHHIQNRTKVYMYVCMWGGGLLIPSHGARPKGITVKEIVRVRKVFTAANQRVGGWKRFIRRSNSFNVWQRTKCLKPVVVKYNNPRDLMTAFALLLGIHHVRKQLGVGKLITLDAEIRENLPFQAIFLTKPVSTK